MPTGFTLVQVVFEIAGFVLEYMVVLAEQVEQQKA